MSWACHTVEDRDDLVALFIPRGATYKVWGPHPVTGERSLIDGVWRHDTLRLMFPDTSYSIWLSWRGDDTPVFAGYYVNFEEPFRRTSIGFDTNDHMLDIVVAPDLTWSWKDAELFDARIRDGVYSPAFGAAVRADAARVIEVIESRGSPFADGWDRWRPDPSWSLPAMPDVWDSAPCVLWDRRAWAYLSTR